jgi:hypothetical protein
MSAAHAGNNECAILARLVQPDGDGLSPEAARAILKLEFSKQDQERMHELTLKNQEETLTEDDRKELEVYLRIGRFLDLLCAKARLSLKKFGQSV